MRRTWQKQRPTVLIVDDDAITRQMVCKRIKSFADTIEAETQLAAEEMFIAHAIDLAIVDLELASGSGLNFIAFIRQQSHAAGIPIIVLSGNETRDGLETALRAGATSFLLKPLSWATFGRYIQQVSEIAFRAGYMALHDPLTGLPNRVLINDRLNAVVKDSPASAPVATYVLDLDRFKPINDAFGHHAGDLILIEVGKRLRTAVPHADVIARMGGDEFAILCTGHVTRNQVVRDAEAIIEAISRPISMGAQSVVVGVSIGVDLRSVSEDTVAEQFLRDADLALGRAKREGRNTFRFFEDSMASAALLRTGMEQNLRQALAEQQLELHYQPIVTVSTRAISGFEALVRWRHPTIGYIAPGLFIPIAEECGLVSDIGRWVLNEACAASARLPKACGISVNVSAQQVHRGDLYDVVQAALEQSGLPPDRLELEIVESILLQDGAKTLEVLRRLQGIGVRIALDDFGTGYSSMSYLQKFPFNKIKIDRSFVASAVTHAGARSIITAVASLARGFSMTSTAEGIETPEQWRMIASEGIAEAQGFLLGKPAAEHVASALLTTSFALDHLVSAQPPQHKGEHHGRNRSHTSKRIDKKFVAKTPLLAR
jgi:diguanylate cyclase (GGDEF)-like protein